MTTIKLNRNHRKGCVCLFCVQARKRYGCDEWMTFRNSHVGKFCIHCRQNISEHAWSWKDVSTGIQASGACIYQFLVDNGLESETFGSFSNLFSREFTFDLKE